MGVNEVLKDTTKSLSVFNLLNSIDVNDKKEKKENLDYLSWADAWGYVKKIYPSASYEILKNQNMLPYFESSAGAMVYTKVTIENETLEMWLPVMDGKNKAMKSESYEYETKSGKKKVEAFTMFDINKTIMRCLTKNLAMFGLGLYIFSKEDLPDVEEVKIVEKNSEEKVLELEQLISETKSDKTKLLAFFKVQSLDFIDYEKCKAMLEKKKGVNNEPK